MTADKHHPCVVCVKQKVRCCDLSVLLWLYQSLAHVSFLILRKAVRSGKTDLCLCMCRKPLSFPVGSLSHCRSKTIT